MHKSIVTLMAGASFLVSPLQVLAQTASPAMAVASSQDAGLAHREALVRRYLKAVDFDKLMNTMMSSMIPALVDQQRKSNPELSEKEGKIVSDSVIEAMADFMPKYMDRVVVIYAQAFTEDELTQMVAFYESPVGQSIARKTPELTPKVMQVMIEMMPDLQSSMKARLCSKMDCKGKPAKT